MTQLVYSREEILREHPYDKAHIVAGHRLHGGFDVDGGYISPRTLLREPAVEAWGEALRERGGNLLDADESLLSGVRYPTTAQQKLLLREGLKQPFWNSLTITGLIEGRGRLLAEAEFPDFQEVIREDISMTATGHLNKGMLVAHGLDEGGLPDQGIGGHDVMWFAARDLAFGPTGYPVPDVPQSIGRPDSDRRLAPEIPQAHEQTLLFLMNLLMIEFRAEILFRFVQEVLRDRALFAERPEGAEQGAALVERIRQDERIHVVSLRTVLGELRELTFKTTDGDKPGHEIVDPLWRVIVDWATIDAPKLAREQQRASLRERIRNHAEGERILSEFDALEEAVDS